VARQMESLASYGNRIVRINTLLDDTRGEIKLRDMLKDESERIVDATIAAERDVIDLDISGWSEKEDSANALMKKLSVTPNAKPRSCHFMLKSSSHLRQIWAWTSERQRGRASHPKSTKRGAMGLGRS
jgi:hypothetical protein